MGLSKALFNDLSEGIKGPKNLITDVSGVKVGHVTIDDGKVHSGVTAIIPGTGNLFRDKLPAGSCVLNGFGKSVGLVQIDELGTLETPIVLTNTFAVGTAVNALTRKMLAQIRKLVILLVRSIQWLPNATMGMFQISELCELPNMMLIKRLRMLMKILPKERLELVVG
ncbi:D-aminopeptidase [Lentilactobacillus kosonis]|uniref:D-aminopeptidase n=1 Tax=Lentilactobacillus kosonis TaxID=2810561 RepID=A0A401FK71_9LACO|nr:D-aminopeptidase [Lentilactobacillus kosonis]